MTDRALDALLHAHGRRLAEGPWQQLGPAYGVPSAGRMNAHAVADLEVTNTKAGWELVKTSAVRPEVEGMRS